MRKLCHVAPAACLLIAVTSTASAHPKVEEFVLEPFDQSIAAFSNSGPHMAINVTKGRKSGTLVDGIHGDRASESCRRPALRNRKNSDAHVTKTNHNEAFNPPYSI
jgi:hypothetical protein